MLCINVLILSFLALAGLSIVYYTARLGISPMPTAPKVLRILRRQLPGELREGKIYELGCAWGSLLGPLRERYPAHRIQAFELSPLPYLFSRLRARKDAQTLVIRGDFFAADLSDAALVICYLFPTCMEALSAKLRKELKPGTYVLTHTFALADWKPLELTHTRDLYRTPVYLYQA